MEKKSYTKPAAQVLRIEESRIICASVNKVESNVNMNYRGGSSGAARTRQQGIWGDDWKE